MPHRTLYHTQYCTLNHTLYCTLYHTLYRTLPILNPVLYLILNPAQCPLPPMSRLLCRALHCTLHYALYYTQYRTRLRDDTELGRRPVYSTRDCALKLSMPRGSRSVSFEK